MYIFFRVNKYFHTVATDSILLTLKYDARKNALKTKYFKINCVVLHKFQPVAPLYETLIPSVTAFNFYLTL